MPIQITKPEPNPATARLGAEATAAIAQMCRGLAPAVEKAGEDMARSFEKLRTQRPA